MRVALPSMVCVRFILFTDNILKVIDSRITGYRNICLKYNSKTQARLLLKDVFPFYWMGLS